MALLVMLLVTLSLKAQDEDQDYKKRVLEATELETLFSYYSQDGPNAAVTGGEGTEDLSDATSTIILRMPLNEDDILTVDFGVSAYTSASSSNVDPFDDNGPANPFSASSGASRSDLLAYFNPKFSHSSDDRNRVWSANLYLSAEYDYFSTGIGGSYSWLFNEKNTEISVGANLFFDFWNTLIPVELRNGFSRGGANYDPLFVPFDSENRNTYSFSITGSQILSKRLQGSITLDLVRQNGLLSNPFQRVYFADRPDIFVEEFQLADDVERLPDTRFKVPIGLRLNYFASDWAVIRGYYRYYFDDWGLNAHTVNIEAPLKLGSKFTVSPSYRYYTQNGVDYFFPKETALSTEEFYTSDFDLSDYSAHQYGIGITYKDIFTKTKIFSFGLKTVDLRYAYYDRSTGLDASIISLSTLFVLDR